MPFGKGKYDDDCTAVRCATKAQGAIVIVIKGEHGSGFSVQGPPEVIAGLPNLLRIVAREIETAR